MAGCLFASSRARPPRPACNRGLPRLRIIICASRASPTCDGERPTRAERCGASSEARRVRGLSTSPTPLRAPKAPPLRPFWQERSVSAHFPHFTCHKIEKTASHTLSKPGPRWYIPPAPAGHMAPGLPSQEAFWNDEDRRGCRVDQPRFAGGFLGACAHRLIAGWSSPVARQAHNLKVASSNLAPATKLSL